MDFILGLSRTSSGYDSVLVIVDQLTKLAHFLPVNVKYTVLDRGPRFTSQFWEELHKAMGTSLNCSIAYHPQTRGQTERVN